MAKPVFLAEELDAYVRYLTYRVQRDLYELCKESGELDDMSWREFVWDIRHWKQIQEAAMITVRETLEELRNKGSFDFDAVDVDLLLDSDLDDRKDGKIYSSKLLDAEEGRALVESILLRAEIIQYKRQLAKGKACSWEYFLADLAEEPSLWYDILVAFRNALAKLDFKPFWQSERLEELMKELNPPAIKEKIYGNMFIFRS